LAAYGNPCLKILEQFKKEKNLIGLQDEKQQNNITHKVSL